MRSSTSSSDSDHGHEWPETYWKRPIPQAHWRGTCLLTVLLVLGFLIAWETVWRLKGYEPSFEETPELWATQRAKVGTGAADEVVFTGSSRILFDFDLDVWQQDFGGPRPIALARPGTNPRPFLTDLANDESFRGLLLVGIAEGLFFLPDPAPPAEEARNYLKHFKQRPLSARSDHILSIPVESAFAFINKEDLSLGPLLRKQWLRLPNRPTATIMPDMPPYFARMSADRRSYMWAKCEQDPALQHKIQQIWLPWFQMGLPLGGPPLEDIFAQVSADVAKIRARGGEVVFLRFPSSGQLWDIEQQRWPREAYWDRLLQETGAPGIHFQDDPSLAGFICPEWSHLTRADAVTYTRNMIPLLREKL